MITKLFLCIVFLSYAAWAANTLVINANVITVDKDRPSAQAFAFENGRFTAVGTNDQILKLKTPSTKIIDLKGMTVTPGSMTRTCSRRRFSLRTHLITEFGWAAIA